VLHLLPTLWFRNVWSWGQAVLRPELRREVHTDADVIAASHPELGRRFLYTQDAVELLFTENETNTERIFGKRNLTPYVKDSINDYVVNGRRDAVNPDGAGTKASAHHVLTVPAGASKIVRLRLTDVAPTIAPHTKKPPASQLGHGFDAVMKARRHEADEFYAGVIPSSLDADQRNVMRQALAGMLWSKQFYYYDVEKWLEERG